MSAWACGEEPVSEALWRGNGRDRGPGSHGGGLCAPSDARCGFLRRVLGVVLGWPFRLLGTAGLGLPTRLEPATIQCGDGRFGTKVETA